MKYSLRSLMLLVTLCGIVIPWTAMLVARFLVEFKAWLGDEYAPFFWRKYCRMSASTTR